jgi:hypothetical protein
LPSESALVAINGVSIQSEEIVAIRGGRVLFCARIGQEHNGVQGFLALPATGGRAVRPAGRGIRPIDL